MKKLKIVILCITLMTALCSCTTNQQVENESSMEGMGRYVGNRINLPPLESQDAYYKGMYSLENGDILCCTSLNTLFVSKDGGKTWTEKENQTLKSIEGENSWIDFSDTGDIILDSFLVDEDNNQISEKQIIYIREDGEKKILPMIAEEVEKIESMSFLQDGRVVGNDREGAFYEINIDTGEKTQLFTCWPNSCKYGYGITRDFIIAVGEDREVFVYNLHTGAVGRNAEVLRTFLKREGSIKEKTEQNSVLLMENAEEENSFYFATQSGLYRYIMGGNLVEQLIDRKQTEFGNPNNELLGMVVKEKGEFLVLFSNNKLMNYTYDSDAPII